MTIDFTLIDELYSRPDICAAFTVLGTTLLLAAGAQPDLSRRAHNPAAFDYQEIVLHPLSCALAGNRHLLILACRTYFAY